MALVGPGVVTVGSVGAKRQLVIPAGEWMLLAAEDHRTSGSELRSLFVASFNRRAIAVPSGAGGS